MKKLDCAGAIIDIELAGIDVLGAYVALTVTLDPHGAQHPFPGGTWMIPVSVCKSLLAEIIAETANIESGIQTAQ